ncbi:unnamed protein product, partial [Brachionus calyciflorus]
FLLDTIQKKIYIKKCDKFCTIADFDESYYLILMCKDNLGRGNVAFSNLIISFKDIFRPGFKISSQTYYLLASGPNGIEIPELIIKPFELDPANKVSFTIQNNEMAKLFFVDQNGLFKILATQLDISQTPNQNGVFNILILASDEFGNSILLTVILQLSKYISNTQCPRISESAICKFSINRETFDSNKIRFCFYGTSPISFNLNSNENKFNSQIFYSLTPDSPNFLYINPHDGCVKILPSFNLENLNQNYIQYSVGVFNPQYPDCININKRSCMINVDSPQNKQVQCSKKYQVVDNSTSFKLNAYSPDANTVLQYSILREERTTFDGTYENITEDTNKFYKIRPNDGLIQLNRVEKLTDYSSILLFIRVQDTTLHSSPTECLVDFKFCNLNSKIA